MKKIKPSFKQLNLSNIALFLVMWAAIEYFGMKACLMFPDWTGDLKWWGQMLFGVFVFVLVLEVMLVFRLDSKSSKPLLTPLLLTHLPWLLGFGVTSFASVTLPAPHDFLLRKIQILFGLMWVSHLFLFSMWLLWRARKNGKRVSVTFAWVAAFFLIGTTLWTTQCDLSGDEPHYLLMAYSLIHDQDLNLFNNYQNADYQHFYHRGVLLPQGLDHVAKGKIYSYHPLGPVLLILPGFYVAGRMGAVLIIALMTAWALFLILRVLEYTGAKGLPLYATGAVGLFTSPFLLFSGLIYPEIPTACLMALILLFYLEKRWGWVGLTAGGMLWMHNRNMILVIPILLFAGYEILKRPKGRLESGFRLAAAFLIPVAGLSCYFYSLYGVLTPLGAHHEPFTSLFRLRHFWDGFFGLVLDQECGLWFHFPIFALMIAGGVLLGRSKNPLKHLIIGTFVFFYFFMSFYENLGLTPATRYMVGVLPLFLPMLYAAFERLKGWDLWMILTLLQGVMGIVVNWLLAAIPWMRYNKLEGDNWILKIAGNFLNLPLTHMEPSFQAPVVELQTYLASIFWVGVTVGFTVLFLYLKKPVIDARKSRKRRP